MDIQRIKEFAQKQNFKTIKFLGDWEGYQVFDTSFVPSPKITPDMSKGEIEEILANLPAIGLPYFILVKGDEIRLSSFPEEYNQIADVFYPEEPDEDEK